MQRVNTTSFRWTMDAAGDWLCIQTNKARQVIDSLKDQGTPGEAEPRCECVLLGSG